jgi:hypothetical protein
MWAWISDIVGLLVRVQDYIGVVHVLLVIALEFRVAAFVYLAKHVLLTPFLHRDSSVGCRHINANIKGALPYPIKRSFQQGYDFNPPDSVGSYSTSLVDILHKLQLFRWPLSLCQLRTMRWLLQQQSKDTKGNWNIDSWYTNKHLRPRHDCNDACHCIRLVHKYGNNHQHGKRSCTRH